MIATAAWRLSPSANESTSSSSPIPARRTTTSKVRSARPSRRSAKRASGDLRQTELAQQGDRVRVDVLARHQTVADRDHVHALVLDAPAGRRHLDPGAVHRAAMGAAGRSLLNDEALAHVRAAGLEGQVRKDRENARDR